MNALGMLSIVRDALHKRLSPESYARKIGVRFGEGCRFINVDFGTEPYLVTLGNHVSITDSHFVTHDGVLWVFRHEAPDSDLFAPITVGNNVFIGMGCIILPGVAIGDNAVIGAHSLVNKDIPSGVIAAGVPARPIGETAAYWQKVQARTLPTKRMSAHEKRAYLEKHCWAGRDAPSVTNTRENRGGMGSGQGE